MLTVFLLNHMLRVQFHVLPECSTIILRASLANKPCGNRGSSNNSMDPDTPQRIFQMENTSADWLILVYHTVGYQKVKVLNYKISLQDDKTTDEIPDKQCERPIPFQ